MWAIVETAMVEPNYTNSFTRAETTDDLAAAFTKYGMAATAHSDGPNGDILEVGVGSHDRDDVIRYGELTGFAFVGDHVDDSGHLVVTFTEAGAAWWLQ